MNVIHFSTGFVHILILPVLSESGSVEGFALLTIVCALSYVSITLMILNVCRASWIRTGDMEVCLIYGWKQI